MTIGPDHYNDIFAESIILRSPNTGAPKRGDGDSSIGAANADSPKRAAEHCSVSTDASSTKAAATEGRQLRPGLVVVTTDATLSPMVESDSRF